MTRGRYARPAPNTAPTESKAAGLYMICTLSKHEAEAKGYDDALMLDYRGFLAEGTGANLFLVMDGKLHTPLPDCFLNGITRQTVIELAKGRGIEVDRAPHRAQGAGRRPGGVPHRHRGRGDAGARDRRASIRDRHGHAPAGQRLRRPDPRAGAAAGGLSRTRGHAQPIRGQPAAPAPAGISNT